MRQEMEKVVVARTERKEITATTVRVVDIGVMAVVHCRNRHHRKRLLDHRPTNIIHRRSIAKKIDSITAGNNTSTTKTVTTVAGAELETSTALATKRQEDDTVDGWTLRLVALVVASLLLAAGLLTVHTWFFLLQRPLRGGRVVPWQTITKISLVTTDIPA